MCVITGNGVCSSYLCIHTRNYAVVRQLFSIVYATYLFNNSVKMYVCYDCYACLDTSL